MPHIKNTSPSYRRAHLVNNAAQVLFGEGLTIADIEYIISQYVVAYVKTNGLSFNTLKDIDGLFSTAQSEFYRLVTGPYENIKAKQNGNAYEEIIKMIEALKHE